MRVPHTKNAKWPPRIEISKIYLHAKVSLHKRNTNIFQNKDHKETKFLCTKHLSLKLAGQPIFAGGSARGVRTGAYLEKHVRSV